MSYKNFGVLLCCASNGVMNVASVKRMVDEISKMGYNLLELVIDDIYKIENEPYFGYLRGGYTKAEIQEMDTYAKSHGVELVPVIQTLAHMTNLVKIPEYVDIVDIDDILLVDEPRTYELIDKMFASIADSFSTRKVNIGFDEAHKVGLGKYLDKHGYTDRFSLLLRHLQRVAEIGGKYRFKIHMWSDMFFRLANRGEYWDKNVHIPEDIRSEIPKNIELCYWNYYSDDEDMYDAMLASHEEFDNELWFAGGAWTWNGFAPCNRFSLKTMLPAMKQVRNHQIENVLVTVWGDDGHDCSYFSVLPSLYAIRQYADGQYDEDVIRQGFQETFGVSFDDFMILDLPNKNRVNDRLELSDNACKVLLFNDCFLGMKDVAAQDALPVPFEKYAEILEKTGARMGEYQYLYDNLAALCHVLAVKAELGIKTRKAYQDGDKSRLQELIADYTETIKCISEFRDTLRAVWMRDNKPYGWDIHEIRLGGLQARMRDCIQRIEEYLDGNVTNIPELEEQLLPYAPWGMQQNFYRRFVTVSEL